MIKAKCKTAISSKKRVVAKQQISSDSHTVQSAKSTVCTNKQDVNIGGKKADLQQSNTTNPKKRVIGRPFQKGVSGNPKGRPKLGLTNFDNLLRAVRSVESKEKKNLLEHFIEQGFTNDTVLVAVMKKLYPDLKSIEQITMPESTYSEQELSEMRAEYKKRFGVK